MASIAGRRDGIARRGERQLVDDHAAERLADHVHALPEARRGEQDAVRRLAELLEELRPRRGPLHQDRIIERHLRNGLHRPQRRVAREEHERAPLRPLQDLDHLAAGRHREIRRSRIGHPRRQIQDRLPREIELRRQLHVVGVADAETVADVVESRRRRSASPRSAPWRACDRTAARGRSRRRRSAPRAGRSPCRGTRRSTRRPDRRPAGGTAARRGFRRPAGRATRHPVPAADRRRPRRAASRAAPGSLRAGRARRPDRRPLARVPAIVASVTRTRSSPRTRSVVRCAKASSLKNDRAWSRSFTIDRSISFCSGGRPARPRRRNARRRGRSPRADRC